MRRFRILAILLAALLLLGPAAAAWAACTNTATLSLCKPARGDLSWDTNLNANFDLIEAALGTAASPTFTGLVAASTTFALINTVATTVNFAGAATTLAIGAASAAVNFAGGPVISGGTAANDDITIQGTTSGTRTTSYVLLQPSGGEVQVGNTLAFLGTTPNTLYGLLASKSYTDPTSGTAAVYIDLFPTYTGAETVAEYITVLQLEAFPIINAGHTNSGVVKGIASHVLRNSNGAAADDDGVLASIQGFGITYGHYNTNASAAPQTTDAYGIVITPYYKKGTINTMYDIYLGAPSTGGTATTRYGFYQASTSTNVFGGNVLIGVTAAGTSFAKGIGLGSGTAPSTSPADMAQMWVADFAAGNAIPYFRTENGTVIGLNQDLLTTASPAFAAVGLTGPAITAGSGTGVTVNDAGSLRQLTYKVTVDKTNCIANAVTCDVTIATLPAKTYLVQVLGDLTIPYACTDTCTTATLSGTLGRTAGASEFLASFDADAAAALFGDANAELGTEMIAAARVANGALIPGVLGAWASTTTVVYRLTSGTGNLGTGSATHLSAGSITFYLVTQRMP